MTTCLALWPKELIFNITKYLEPNDRTSFSMLERRIHALILETIKCIRIIPPTEVGYPKNIMRNIIGRYPNLNKIIFNSSKKNLPKKTNSINQIPYIKSFISYLENNRNHYILSRITTIYLKKIYLVEGLTVDEMKNINRLFLRSIGHIGLNKIKILHCGFTLLSPTDVQPVLDNSPNLKTFECNEYLNEVTGPFSFNKLTNLSKLKIFKISTLSLKSLENCKMLTNIGISYLNYNELMIILSNDILCNIKYLFIWMGY